MAHLVERAMLSRKRAWWEGTDAQGEAIAVRLPDVATSAEAIAAAGLDWDVIKVRAGFQALNEAGEVIFREANEDCYLLRDSDQSILGHATDKWQPIQNRSAFSHLDGLAKDGSIRYETAGSLERGKRVWILALTPNSWTVRRRSGALNHHYAYLLNMLGHDGVTAHLVMPTDVRAECSNTVGFAQNIADREQLIFRIPHTGDVDAKLALAHKAIEVMVAQSDERRRVLQELAQYAMNVDEFVDFATSVMLGLDGEQSEIEATVAKFYEDATPRSKTIMENKVAAVAALFLKGQGAEGNSAYDAVQAFTEAADHFDIGKVKDRYEASKRTAKKMASSWIGAGAERKALVWKRLAERVRR